MIRCGRPTAMLFALAPLLHVPATLARPPVHPLVQAARSQVGGTVHYDPAYVRLDYPGGDVPIARADATCRPTRISITDACPTR